MDISGKIVQNYEFITRPTCDGLHNAPDAFRITFTDGTLVTLVAEPDLHCRSYEQHAIIREL